jgi:lipopolysaccharide transport system permease protein
MMIKSTAGFLSMIPMALPLPTPEARLHVISPIRRWHFPDFREIWEYRELLMTLTLRDIKVRYKQTALGIGWAIIQPVMTMVVFTVIFGKLAKIPSDGIPYPVFAFAALLPWQFFTKALTLGSMSLVTLQGMLTKVYFPRLIAPISSILAGLVDFAISSVVLFALMGWFQVMPHWSFLALPLLILQIILISFGVSLWLSGLNVEFRDVQYALPFVVQVWMYLTPVVYPASMVPEAWRPLYMLNPIAGVVEGFRWALLGTATPPDLLAMSLSIAVTAALIIGGLIYFARVEQRFADRV